MSERLISAEIWERFIQSWGIPDWILSQAPESPWIHHVESFRPRPSDISMSTPSIARSREALFLESDASVLDVGCGAGRSSLPLVEYARHFVGVDQQDSMIDSYREVIGSASARCDSVVGTWPNISRAVPRCTIAISHHVLFNVSDIVGFTRALDRSARKRVVLEITIKHPLDSLSAAWKRFWDLDRPIHPTAQDAFDVVTKLGYRAKMELFENPNPKSTVSDMDVRHTRIRLCLSASRDPEVRDFLESQPRTGREFATIWWDTSESE